MIGLNRKRHLFGAEKLKDSYFSAESTFQESVSKHNLYGCARTKKKKKKKRCCSNIPLTLLDFVNYRL